MRANGGRRRRLLGWNSSGQAPPAGVAGPFGPRAGAVADFDGDGAIDNAVFRPSTGQWFLRGIGTIQYGVSTDVPVPGDYNGDATTDIAIYRRCTGQCFLRGIGTIQYGAANDMPQPGDYTGDATTDLAVHRRSTGQWLMRGIGTVQYGTAGDVPLALPHNLRKTYFP